MLNKQKEVHVKNLIALLVAIITAALPAHAQVQQSNAVTTCKGSTQGWKSLDFQLMDQDSKKSFVVKAVWKNKDIRFCWVSSKKAPKATTYNLPNGEIRLILANPDGWVNFRINQQYKDVEISNLSANMYTPPLQN